MLFNSFDFVAYFAFVTGAYHLLPRQYRWILVLAASCYFYMAFIPVYILILFFTIIFDYYAGLMIERSEGSQRKMYLLVSLVVNLGVLCFFKYFNFVNTNLQDLAHFLHWNYPIENLRIILPIGLSFHTFQSMSYTIEVYRGHQKAERNIGMFALYVMYYPQLVAGPIERATALLPQLQNPRPVDRGMLASGFQLMMMGFLKKVAIADSLAPYANKAFEDPSALSSPALLISLYMFAIQIYCDFSGYTDIARGASRWMGIDLMINFKQPYLSRNITEFWRRWHISLSFWLRDYLYISLGGNRGGRAKTIRNLMLTMLLGGLWHGASWTFVVWGGLHGLYLALHKLMTGDRKIGLISPPEGMKSWLVFAFQAFATFNLVCLTWIFFRAADFTQAWAYLSGIFTNGFHPDYLGLTAVFAFYSILILIVDLNCWYEDRELPLPDQAPVFIRGLAYAAALFLISFVGVNEVVPFIYFQF